jgi:hypothetical protein
MNTRGPIYVREPDVSWRSLENQAVLIHNKHGEIRVLNETGTLVWEHLEEGLEAISAVIARQYDVDEATARRDAEDLIRELMACGAIRESEG